MLNRPLGKGPPCRRTGLQVGLLKGTRWKRRRVAAVSSACLTLERAKPYAGTFPFRQASSTPLSSERPAYFSSSAAVPQVLSRLASGEAERGDVTRATGLWEGAEGKVAAPSRGLWCVSKRRTVVSGWRTSSSSASSQSKPAKALQGALRFKPE